MKELKFRFLSFRLIRIMCSLFALCVSQYHVTAQEIKCTKNSESVANVVLDQSKGLLQFDGKSISNASHNNLNRNESLSSFSLPKIKATSRASNTINVSGTIDASTLADNAELVLTGNTNLFLDVNKTLKSISGDYTLTLSGGNILTLNNPEGYAINVSSVTISAPLVVSSSYIAIGAQTGLTINNTVNATSTNTCMGTVDGTITINADVTAKTTSSAGILNRSGDIIINKGTINVNGGISGDWAYGIAALGNVSSKAGTTINVTGGTAIYSEKENIHLLGDVTATAKGKQGYGLYAKLGDISVETVNIPSSYIAIGAQTGLTINNTVNATSTNTCMGTVDGTITINADVTAKTTSSAGILNRSGDIIINKGTINVNGGISGDWAYGIAALGNVSSKAGTTINVTGGTAIYSEKENIHLLGDVTATAKGKQGYGLYAKLGDISVETVNIPSSYIAIGAQTGLTINNTVNATSTNTCMGTVDGTITINADVTAKTTSSAGILNRSGDIIINKGKINATGGDSGNWAYGVAALGNINIKSGEVVAKGGSNGLFAQNGAITIDYPLMVASPSNGRVSDDGHTIVDENNDRCARVVIMTPPLSGTVTLTSVPTPGLSLGFAFSGNANLAETKNIWQISENNESWLDIENATDKEYVPKETELGKYIRVRVEAIDFSGYLYSPSRQITKQICTIVPEAPILTNISDKVNLSNAKTTQEYIIFNYSKEASSLTESDWKNAVSPDNEIGFFEMNSSNNATHTVFTRIKETTSTWASENVAESRIYIGTSVYLQDIDLSISKVSGYFQNICNELNCKVGDVIRCDALPVPANATNWYGISGSNWTVDYRNTGSPYGTFYEDADCTIPISSSSNYETVYLKTLAEKNYLEVRIMTYNSSIGNKTRAVQFNVSYDGTFPPIDYISGCGMTIAAGEKMTNLDVGRRPLSASVYGVTTEVSGEGTAPIVKFNMYEKMNVDATAATPGVYTYTPIQNGNPIKTSSFTITVTDGNYRVDSILIREKYIVANPGEHIEILAQLMPANSKADIEWYSTNENIAPIVDGVVTIAPDAPIGAEVYITAQAMGCFDNCKITISGEKYELYVASTQVTSRNREDVLGDGKFSFDGINTLSINGDYSLNTPVRMVENTGIDGLIIDVVGNSSFNQDVNVNSNVFEFAANTTITGNGKLTINANSIGISVSDNATLTISDADIVVSGLYPATGNIGGNESLTIFASNVEISAKGSAAVDDFNGGISLIDCVIASPVGGKVVDATIEDGNGNYARNVVIKPQLMLYDDIDNSATLETYATSGKTTNVQLVNRTFCKDNNWTTLCLPFDVTNLNGTPLEGATVMELNTTSRNGFDSSTGTLYLSFKTVTTIDAGKPYIVKWDSGDNIENPIFENIIITNYKPIVDASETFELNSVYMTGNYAPLYVSGGDQSIMFMGANNVIYYPTEDVTLNSFHSYFEIPSLQGGEEKAVKSYIIDFDGVFVGIEEVKNDNVQYPEGWYTITGIKLPQMPTGIGIYINNGRKVIINK